MDRAVERELKNISLAIDGKAVSVPEGTLVIEAARMLGIEIPYFCYHPKMDPVGACRMCLVETGGRAKLITACTTRVEEGMTISTDSISARKGQKDVLEFLLTNHPLDCPVCDKGGECPLQDNTYKYGPAVSRFTINKWDFKKPVELGPYILLDRERCIMCMRCTRFSDEIAGHPQIGVINSGRGSEIGVMQGQEFNSIFSGNTIEICPVGALTSKLFRFSGRPWEFKNRPGICANCAVGCNINWTIRRHEILRVISRENPDVDDGWLCDRGRFGYTHINSPDRLTSPLIKRNGRLVPAGWDEAISFAAQRLDEITLKHGNESIGGIGFPALTNEEAYLFQKFMRKVIGSNNIDHWPKGNGAIIEKLFEGSAKNGLRRFAYSHLDEVDLIFLVGTDISGEQPVLDLRIKKAVRKRGARLIILHHGKTDLTRYSSPWLKYKEGEEMLPIELLKRIILKGAKEEDIKGEAEAGSFSSRLLYEAGMALSGSRRTVILLGNNLPDGVVHAMFDLASGLLRQSGERHDDQWISLGLMMGHANSQGVLDMGLDPDYLPGYVRIDLDGPRAIFETAWGFNLPRAKGLSAAHMLNGGNNGAIKALFMMGSDQPSVQSSSNTLDLKREGIEFLLVSDITLSGKARMADVVFPSCTHAEKDGTFTNAGRRVQSFQKAIRPVGDSLSEWQILCNLATEMGEPFNYLSVSDIMEEISTLVPSYKGINYALLGDKGVQLP